MFVRKVADDLGVPPERFAAFSEVCEAIGYRGARQWEELLQRVRSASEVEQRISERPELLSALHGSDERAVARAKERLKYWGRYSARMGTQLDEALDAAAVGIAASLKTAVAGKLRIRVSMGIVDDEHLNCQRQAMPYGSSPMVVHGAQAIDARAAEDSGVVKAGTLLGYIMVVRGGYIAETAVLPDYQGHDAARALLAGAALSVMANGGVTLCVDVRSGNIPAINLCRSLGFKISSLQHPGFFDWDGGYFFEAAAKNVATQVPANAEIIMTEKSVENVSAGNST